RDEHAERQAVLDLEDRDRAGAQPVEVLEELHHLRLEQEVAGVALRPGAVLAPELDLADDPRLGVEDGVAVADGQALDAAEVDALHQLDQSLPGFRERGLRQASLHVHLLRRPAQRDTPRSRPGDRLFTGCAAALDGGWLFGSPGPAFAGRALHPA